MPGSVKVDRIAPLLTDELFLEGSIQVQDEASQIAGLTVGIAPGEMVLDACAGLGTKSRQMGALAPGARIVVMDVDVSKVARAGADLPVAADAARPPFSEGLFDAVLLDAPCSSLGVVRKHPEIKWRRQEKEIASFGRRQIGLLRSLWDTVRPGGRLVYSVCSFEPEETAEVIEAFARERKFVLEKAPSFLFNKDSFLSLPHTTGMDGFFVARLMKP
jgi:16S rRNA (cytosine967-C5)-methyltransferase